MTVGPVQIRRMRQGEFYELVRELDERKFIHFSEPQLPLDRLPKKLAQSVTEASKGSVPECVECGVCCGFPQIVPLMNADLPVLDGYWEIESDESATGVVIERVLPRDAETARCTHLRGEFGGSIGCGIYETRPFVCRDFDAGSDRCHEYRRMYGIEPKLTDQEAEFEAARLPRLEAGRISLAVISLDWRSTRTVLSFDDLGPTTTETEQMKITVFLDGDDECGEVIHSYDPTEESWTESDLIGLTMAEAKELVQAGKLDR